MAITLGSEAFGTTEFLTWSEPIGVLGMMGPSKALEAEFVITSWNQRHTGEISSVPIEDGAEIADHYIQRPDELTVELVVTNQPFRADKACGVAWEKITLKTRPSKFVPHGLYAITEGVSMAVDALLGATGLTDTVVWVRKVSSGGVMGFGASSAAKDFIGDFHDQLIKIKEGVYECSLSFKGRVMSNLIIESIDLVFSNESGGKFKVNFRGIKKVETRVAGLPVPKDLVDAAAKAAPSLPMLQSDDEAEARQYSETNILGGLL